MQIQLTQELDVEGTKSFERIIKYFVTVFVIFCEFIARDLHKFVLFIVSFIWS